MLIVILEERTSYEIKIQAFNKVGAGNSSILVIVKTQGSSSTEKPLSSGTVIGIVIGAILFLIFLLITLYFVRRKILKEQHAKSVLVSVNFIVSTSYKHGVTNLECLHLNR